MDRSLHLLICSFEFDLGSEGICTGRLVRALLEAGCRITLVTSETSDTDLRHEGLIPVRVPTAPSRPRKGFHVLARLLGQIPAPHYLWCRRVAALPLEPRPDLIYGRALPMSGVVAGHALAARARLPLWTHFSDPVPSPWVEPNSREFKGYRRDVGRLIGDSQAVSFSTRQAVAYEQETLARPIEAKAFVLRHIAPEPAFLPRRAPGLGRTFAYFGLFYGKRTATALLEGFALYHRSNPASRFLFVGSHPEAVLPDATRLGIESAIRVLDRVSDVRPLMAQADVLVALDAPVGQPVFLTTKLIEYLVVNRPVLLISPAGSPGADLVGPLHRTVTLVTRQDAQSICDGAAQAAALEAGDAEYARRFAAMQEFSARAVAARFLDEAAKRGILNSRGS